MADSALTGGHVAVTRRLWDEHMSAWFERYARSRWVSAEPYRGMWCIPQSRLPVHAGWPGWPGWRGGGGAGLRQRVRLGVAGPAWRAAGRGGRFGPAAGRRARRLQGEFGLRFPLVQADAERVPLGAGCADLVIGEYGAWVWCDPYRWIPEAARLLRPGGRLVFMAQSTLARLCIPEQGPATGRLVRDLFGLHRIVQPGTSGSQYQLFTLPHGEWIRLLGRSGLAELGG